MGLSKEYQKRCDRRAWVIVIVCVILAIAAGVFEHYMGWR